MPALRDFFGTKCPSCKADILQPAPSIARMPPGQYAWCPTCESAMSLEDLAATSASKGILGRFFRGPSRA